MRAAAALLLGLCACRPRGDAATPARAESGARLRLQPAAMKGASCTFRVADETGPSESPLQARTEYVLAFDTAGDDLTIQVRSVQAELVVGPAVIHTRVTPELIEEPSNEWKQVVRKAADDEQARKQIDAVLGAPHFFVRVDEVGRIVDYREDMQTELKIPSLAGLGLAWALALPALPVEPARVGDEWQAARFFPNKPDADPARAFEVSYRLVGVHDGVATIGIRLRSENPVERGSPAGIGVAIDGEAKTRIRDGRPLETKLEVRLDVESEQGKGGWTTRYAGTCAP